MSDGEDQDGEIVVTPPQPIHDATRTRITWREAYDYLKEIGNRKSVTDRDNDYYRYPRSIATRRVKENTLKRPDGFVNYRHYDFETISYNGQD